MSLIFHCGSGSPFGWRVHLALEHKALEYETHLVSFVKREHKSPKFLGMNPRGKVPVLQDGEFALYESSAINEYLDERFPEAPRLFPDNLKGRAVCRRIISEVDHFLWRGASLIADEVFFKPAEEWNPTRLREGSEACLQEISHYAAVLAAADGPFLQGSAPTAADYTLYPMLAMLSRFEQRGAGLNIEQPLRARLGGWLEAVETLPFFAKTYPPHWKS